MKSSSTRYGKSEAILSKALEVIPLGSQVFSKSLTHIPKGVSPFFVDRGEGCRFIDVDGYSYIDMTSGLLALLLGYQNNHVKNAVIRQIDNGVSFSIAHPLEVETAERINALVPCSEMVRFCKNASDATTASIRLARHITGRDHVALSGYHGWHDWSIGTTTRDSGVPNIVKSLSHKFQYNNLDSLKNLLEQHSNQFAAVILEPMNREWPKADYLKSLKRITQEHGALLIFDETITGFRFAKGGAQELFGVVPDLAVFGKGMANGYPLACLVGPTVLMKEVSNIFFSTTFGGETLSLAAACAVLDVVDSEPVVEHLSLVGTYLSNRLNRIIETNQLGHIFSLDGHASWKIWRVNDHPTATQYEIKTFMLQELYARGVFTIGSHNMNYCHNTDDLDLVIDSYSEVLNRLNSILESGNGLSDDLESPPLTPLFSVR